MSDDRGVWFPPPEPMPQGPVAGQPPVPPSVAIPPPPPAFPPPLPPKRSRTGLIVGAIVSGSLVVLALLVVGVVFIVGAIRPSTPALLEAVSGEPGSAVALSPLDCPEACFEPGFIPKTIFDADDVAPTGLTVETAAWGDYASQDLQGTFDATAGAWATDGGSPESCFFVYYAGPMADPLSAAPGPSQDRLEFTGSHSDPRGTSYLSQSVRLFETSQSAVAHMAQLEGAIATCHGYDSHPAGEPVTSTVTAAPAIAVPSEVSALGWVEDTGTSRYYVFDVQKANLVVRTYLTTDGSVTEEEYRQVVTELAARLGKLNPVLYPPYVPPSGCERECLTANQAASLAPADGELAVLGEFAGNEGNAAIAPTTIEAEWNDAGLAYRSAGGEPAVCFFTLSDAPIERDAADFAFRADPVLPLGSYVNGEGAVLTQTARVYTAEIFASRHIGYLRSPIEQCAEFSYGARQISLSARDFATGIPAVASAGWVETSVDRQRFVADLLYANVAMRLTLEQPPGGAVTEDQFGAYVSTVAARMQALG